MKYRIKNLYIIQLQEPSLQSMLRCQMYNNNSKHHIWLQSGKFNISP
jgi:hypothetical protein